MRGKLNQTGKKLDICSTFYVRASVCPLADYLDQIDVLVPEHGFRWNPRLGRTVYEARATTTGGRCSAATWSTATNGACRST